MGGAKRYRRRSLAQALPPAVLALALAAALAAAPDTTLDAALAPPDSTEPARPVRVYPRFDVGALYSPTYGVGLGGGVLVKGLGRGGTRTTVDARVSQFLQSADVSFATRNPDRYTHGFLGGTVSTETRRPYFGVGPFTEREDRLFLDMLSASAEARLGVYPTGSRALYVQPGVRAVFDRLRGLAADQEQSLGGLDPASRRAVQSVEGVDRTGVSAGLALGADLRDNDRYPERGAAAHAEARRFWAQDGSGLRFWRVASSASAYQPLGALTLTARADLALTRGETEPLPFYYLPALDDRLLAPYPRGRLRGRDVLVVGAGARLPLADVLGLYGIDLTALGTLGNAYDDVFEQFELRVAESDDVPAAGRAPLRPTAGVGLNVVDRVRRSVLVGAHLGFGPEGSIVTTFRLAYDLRDLRPLHR